MPTWRGRPCFADQFEGARKAAADALAKAPDTLESQLAAGEVARLDGDYYAARAAYRRATQIDPKDWRGWHGLARVEGERGNVERSRRNFGQALALGERSLVLGERGALEASANELEAARKTLDAALALQPDDYTTWAGLGYARLRSGDPDGAIDALVRATLIEPRYARAHIHLAVAYWQQGLREQAFSSLQRASVADPRDPLPYQYAAMMRGDLMQPGLAAEQAREALARIPYVEVPRWPSRPARAAWRISAPSSRSSGWRRGRCAMRRSPTTRSGPAATSSWPTATPAATPATPSSSRASSPTRPRWAAPTASRPW